MKIFYMLLLGILVLTACAQAATPEAGLVETAVAQTMVAQQPKPTAVPPTATPKPTKEILPTDTNVPPTEVPAAGGNEGKEYSWNNLASQESGKVKIDIARILIGDKALIESKTGNDFTRGGAIDIYNDKPVMGEIVFKVTNNNDIPINVYTDQGKVIVGSEQIELFDYAFFGEFGEDFSGEIYPGVTVIGGIWFGIKRSAVDDINRMQIFIDGPSDNNLNTLGPDFEFDIDLSERKNEPMPDELK